MAQILPFPTETASSTTKSPLAYFVHIGEAHNKLSDLHTAGRLPASRVVVDSSRARYQRELIKSLRNEGAEIVLDTEAVELAAPSKFRGHVRSSPWAQPGASGPLGPEFFLKDSKVAQLRLSKADAARLEIDADSLMARLRDQSTRLAKSKLMLETLSDLGGSEAARARAAPLRRYSETSSKKTRND